MTSLQYWSNQFKKYGEPYYKWQFTKLTLDEFLNLSKRERGTLIKYLKKPSLLESINNNTVLTI